VQRKATLDELIDRAPALPCGYETPKVKKTQYDTAIDLGDGTHLTIEEAEGYAFAILRAVQEAKRG
jgi:hypothetical protein